tara:strand:+ start:80 stop:460 length:381 start_codon:yes stop_codon:yes gene_type:complete
MTKDKRKGNQVKKLLIILYSIFFIVGCNLPTYPDTDYDHWYHKPSECPDPKATNYYWCACDIESPDSHPDKCPWETNEDCEYCEDQYDTEEERWDNCCNISGAKNYHPNIGWWDNNSQDSTYCIFD